MTSDTPRTDKALLTYTGGEYVTFPRGLRCVVDADFARQLERELAAVTAENTQLRDLIKAMAHHLPNWNLSGLNIAIHDESPPADAAIAARGKHD